MSFFKKISLAGILLCLLIFWAKTGRAATLQFEEQTWDIKPGNLQIMTSVKIRSLPVLKATKEIILGQSSPTRVTLFDEAALNKITDVLSKINQNPKSAKLVIQNDQALEFEPDISGQAVNVFELYQDLTDSNKIVALPVFVSLPEVSLAHTNNLGIKELVATGESDFTGSPKNRIHNIKAGASRFNGVIIKPGKEFSFNKYLGDVDGEHGFLPELVIKRTGVVPEFGGGLCQVSSTAFRAAMNSGLPILERRSHSLAVRYYAPQGTDATIYPGLTDMRFKNDLTSHLLVRTRIEKTKLYFDFYGTKDSRLAEFDGPYQYDKKADGSMKAIWTRKVILQGSVSEQTFKSTYLPPALFHPEEQASTPNPTPPPPNPEPIPSPAPY